MSASSTFFGEAETIQEKMMGRTRRGNCGGSAAQKTFFSRPGTCVPLESSATLTLLWVCGIMICDVLIGGVGVGTVDLEDIKFHQCVKLNRFETDRTISFIPPDGNFDLMSYRSPWI